MSLVLSANTDDTLKDLNGVHLKWTNSISYSLVELDLMYRDTVSKTIGKFGLATNATTFSVPSSALTSGRLFQFWLYAVDTTGVIHKSVAIDIQSPYILAKPVLTVGAGVDNGIILNVATSALESGEALTGSPLITFVLVEQSVGATPIPFFIDKPYGQSSYTLTTDDDSKISNDRLYSVSCFVKPDPADTLHNASELSATVLAQPRDLPNKTTVSVAGNNPNGTMDGSWSVSWSAPPDISFWSRFNNSKVDVKIYMRAVTASSYGTPVTLTSPSALTYTFPAMAYDRYQVQLAYVNDRGEGELSDAVYYYNLQSPAPPQNLTAVIDPAALRVNLSFSQPANFNSLLVSRGYTVIQYNSAMIEMSRKSIVGGFGSFNTFFDFTDKGSFFNYRVAYEVTNPNTNGIASGSQAAAQVKSYVFPALVKNGSAVAGDGRIVFGWSSEAEPADGNSHSSNSAKIVLTDGAGFTQSYDRTGGSGVISGLTNGTNYTATIYNTAVTPLNTPIQETVGVTFTNLKPFGTPAVPTGIVVTPTDGGAIVTWTEVVGTISNGAAITGFDIDWGNSQDLNITASTFTKTGLNNGFNYGVIVRSKNAAGNTSAWSSPITISPFGRPIASNIVFSGKTVTATITPNGKQLLGFDVIALSSAPLITDELLRESPADITTYPGYSSATSGSFPLSFTFNSASNSASAIFILTSDGGTSVKSTMVA